MNRIETLVRREHGFANTCSYDFALRRLCVAKEDSWRGIAPSNFGSDYNPEPPIFSAKFANCDGYRHILAIANEDGKIALQDTTQKNYDSIEKSLNAPQCHYNAVFDLEWAPGQMKFVSASGDHTARLWEVDGSELRNVRHFMGHSRSVKTAAFRRNDASVFATGGRDGAIIIWDTRANLNVDMTPRADNCIFSGHVGGPGTPGSQKKRTPKMVANNATSSSITGLAFQDYNTLISCGAGDGVIKVWDLRRNYSAYRKEPLPKHSLPYAGCSTFKGFTNLIIDRSGSRLFANCMDNTIYCYNLCSYSPKPLALYKGLMNSTFYIKSCLSPDDKYLLSGSSDEKAYIWNLDYPDEPLVSLAGHTVEVTCVAWGATNDNPIVTCSDDARHKIWRIGPEDISDGDRGELYRGHAEYVRRFDRPVKRSTHKYNLRDLESTPRSMKRLVEQNERTPGSMEKVTSVNKRSYAAMCEGGLGGGGGNDERELKRPKTMESRARRLFSPSSSATASCSSSSSTQVPRSLSIQLPSISEEATPMTSMPSSPLSRTQMTPGDSNQENESSTSSASCSASKVLSPTTVTSTAANAHVNSPLSERFTNENFPYAFISPPAAMGSSQHAQTQPQPPLSSSLISSSIFSPTSNLPNYVLDGDAPHLSVMSPKRKLKDKVDWLTKIRKQKLMSSNRGQTLSDKMNDDRHGTHDSDGGCVGSPISSPRLETLRMSDESPHLSARQRRRTSHCGLPHSPSSAWSTSSSLNTPKTPTSSRRNSETSILEFFRKQTPQQPSIVNSHQTSLNAVGDGQASLVAAAVSSVHVGHGMAHHRAIASTTGPD